MDLDGDGLGECGTLGELTGLAPLRGSASGARLESPLLPPSLRSTVAHGTATRAGYAFRLFLPGRDGRWVRVDEDPGGRDVDEAETRWCAFAWPRGHGPVAARTFRIDQTGRVTATGARLDPSRLARLDVADWVEVR